MSKLTKHGMMHKKQRKQNKMSSILKGLQLNELSNTKLGDYKTAAGADASKADSEGDYKRGNKRMSGIIKATKKEFANDAKKLKEFAPVGGDDREPDEEEILRQLAAKWWLGTEQEMSKSQKTLAAMGWDIGQDESGDDDAGVFVIRVGDENGDSYIAFNHSELEELNEAFNNYHANRTGFSRGQRDDERHDLDTPTQVWGLKINGKVWSKDGKDVTFTSKQAALNTRNAILKNRPDLEIGLITKGGSPASGAQSKTDDNFRAYLAQRKAGEQLDEIIDPSTALAKALRYVGRKFAQTFPLLAVGGVGAGLAASGLMAPIVASMGGISTALSALSAEMAFSAGMAGTYAAPSIIQTIKDLFAADENSIQAGIKRWVEKYVGDDNDVQEFMLVHSKAAYEGKPGFRWRAKQWPVKMTREQAEAYLEKNDKSWLDFEKQKAIDAEKAKAEQGTADMSNIQKPMNEGVPSDNDMGVVPDVRSGTSTKMTLGQWKQMWLKKMPHADQGMFRYPPAMKGSFIAYFDGWENTPGARWDPQQSVSEEQLDELKCWPGHHRVAGTKAGAPGSCEKNKTNEEGVAAGIPTSSLTSRYMDDPNHPSYKSTTSPKKEKTLQDILKDNDFAALQIWARNNSNNPLVKGASAAGDAAANNIKQQLGLAGKMSYEIPADVMMDKINPVTTKAMFDYLRTHAQQGVAEGYDPVESDYQQWEDILVKDGYRGDPSGAYALELVVGHQLMSDPAEVASTIRNILTYVKQNRQVLGKAVSDRKTVKDAIIDIKNKFPQQYQAAQQPQGVAEERHSCPHCGGEMVSEELMNEKKDACYYKVKSRYKVWPSAYASGALVKCRNKGAKNWGNGGKKNESVAGDDDIRPQGKILKKLHDIAYSSPTLTFQNFRQSGKEAIITDAIMACKIMKHHYLQNKNQPTAQIIYNLENELDDFRRGRKLDTPDGNEYTMDLSDLMQRTLGKMRFQQKVDEDQIDEKWTKKYKDSINCSNPKGFSQKAHCAGKQKNESSILEGINRVEESLHDWFNKEKWVRMDTKGNIKGPCAKEPGEGKPKCLPQAKAHSLGKKGRASAAAT
jgi:hypothetical protein